MVLFYLDLKFLCYNGLKILKCWLDDVSVLFFLFIMVFWNLKFFRFECLVLLNKIGLFDCLVYIEGLRKGVNIYF